MRIRLKNLIAASTCLAVLIAYLLVPPDLNQPIWRDSVLKYETPSVPEVFCLEFEKLPTEVYHPLMANSPSSPFWFTIQATDGTDLFKQLHRHGWYFHRRMFYLGVANPNRREFPLDIIDLEPEPKWMKSHSDIAFQEGYLAFFDQVNERLKTEPFESLRSRMAYSPYWRLVPFLIALTIAVVIFSRNNNASRIDRSCNNLSLRCSASPRSLRLTRCCTTNRNLTKAAETVLKSRLVEGRESLAWPFQLP